MEWYLHTWSVPETMPAKVYDPLVPIVLKFPVLSPRRHSLIDHSRATLKAGIAESRNAGTTENDPKS